MTPLTLNDVLAHQEQVPWPLLYQVEQDLLLCRAMVAIFNDTGFLANQVAMRGGTVLHKVHLAPAARYSEDIDLVVVGDRPEEHIRAGLKRVLKSVLGEPKSSAWDYLKLAVRNAGKPSRILRVIYQIPSVSMVGRLLTVEVEANVSERKPYLPIVRFPFAVPFRGQTLSTNIPSFDVNEMLGTKMRALFQRQKGRDLFDLFWALTVPGVELVEPQKVLDCFKHYMTQEGTKVGRNEFLENLNVRLGNLGFCTDMNVLLLDGLSYDVQAAGVHVRNELLMKLPQ
jgi:predicted nucleotidyltransferase component of viral defense system